MVAMEAMAVEVMEATAITTEAMEAKEVMVVPAITIATAIEQW